VVHIAATNPEGRWRKFSYEELKARDKTSLDVFWLRDKSLTDLDNLPEPDELADRAQEAARLRRLIISATLPAGPNPPCGWGFWQSSLVRL